MNKFFCSLLLICVLFQFFAVPLRVFADYDEQVNWADLGQDDFHRYLEDQIYLEISDLYEGTEYVLESVEVDYVPRVSKEYVSELAYNSKKNIYFGYTAEELDARFSGQKYFFTINENDETEARLYSAPDKTVENAIKDLAIGGGGLLICATFAVVGGPLMGEAVAVVCTAALQAGVTGAVLGAVTGAVIEGALTALRTEGDWDEVKRAAIKAASHEFKVGAYAGMAVGGISKAYTLYQATRAGLTMNQVAIISKETGLPEKVISQIDNFDQYEKIIKTGNFKYIEVGNQKALIRDIDLNYIGPGQTKTNLQLMQKGFAPFDPLTGKRMELHHIGQKNDGILMILTQNEHRMGENYCLWHPLSCVVKVATQINRGEFALTRSEFWTDFAKMALALP